MQRQNGQIVRSQVGQIVRSKNGQIVVEYVLLLSIAVTMAMIIISALVKRADTPEDSGALIQKWRAIQDAIGLDKQN